ncbi:MAG: hypothetical protein KDA22_02210 [Phycisphaerales bacterium]|nr:hypothetical protein [Phycisphaerales bacterium]
MVARGHSTPLRPIVRASCTRTSGRGALAAPGVIGLLLLGAPPAAHGGFVVTWDGSCGTTDWNTVCVQDGLPDSNWDGFAPPSLTDNAVIGRNAPVVTIAGIAEANALTCDSGLQILGSSTLRLGAGTSFLVGLNLVGNSGGGFEFTVPGAEVNLQNSAIWAVGTVSGAGEVVNLGDLNPIVDPQAMTMTLVNGAGFRNDSGADANLRFVQIGAGSTFENAAGATLTLVNGPVPLTGYLKGPGIFTNAGTLVSEHLGTDSQEISAFLVQTGGSFVVQGDAGGPSGPGTYLDASGLFTGGTIAVNDDLNLRFTSGSNPLPYVFDGLASIAGNGNLFVEVSISHDWQVLSPMTVALSGSNGFVIGGQNVTLGAPLTNTGKAKWSSGRIRKTACTDCDPVFVNESDDFAITSSVILATTFHNTGEVQQDNGPITFQTDGRLLNNGVFRLVRGNLQKSGSPANIGFENGGTVRKPASPSTQDSTISIPFVHGAGAELFVEAAKLVFSGGSLDLAGGAVTVDAPGALSITDGVHRAESGTDTVFSGSGRVEVIASGLAGGLRADDGATITFQMSGADNDGLHVGVGGRIGGDGLVVNAGTMFLEGGTIGVQTDSGMTATVENTFDTFVTGGSIQGPTSTFLNDDSGVVVHSAGTFSISTPGALVVNHGTWRETPLAGGTALGGSTSGVFLNDVDGLFVHAGIALGTTEVDVNCALHNLGTVLVKQGGRLYLNGPVLDLEVGELGAGTWIVEPGGGILFADQFGIINATGQDATIVGHQDAFDQFEPAVNHGELRCNDDWGSPGAFENDGTFACDAGTFTCPDDFQNLGGHCSIGQGAALAVAGGLINAGDGGLFSCDGGTCSVEGDFVNGDPRPSQSVLAYADNTAVQSDAERPGATTGFVCRTFVNNAIVRPGGPGVAGSFPIDGDLQQLANGVVEIELAGSKPVVGHDQVAVTGHVTLAGLVRVSLLPGFRPRKGSTFTILTAGDGIQGAFDAVASTDGAVYSVAQNQDAVTLTLESLPVFGDLDGDGVVDGADLGALLGAWGPCPADGTSCAADLDGDGAVGGADLGLMLAAWSA